MRKNPKLPGIPFVLGKTEEIVEALFDTMHWFQSASSPSRDYWAPLGDFMGGWHVFYGPESFRSRSGVEGRFIVAVYVTDSARHVSAYFEHENDSWPCMITIKIPCHLKFGDAVQDPSFKEEVYGAVSHEIGHLLDKSTRMLSKRHHAMVHKSYHFYVDSRVEIQAEAQAAVLHLARAIVKRGVPVRAKDLPVFFEKNVPETFMDRYEYMSPWAKNIFMSYLYNGLVELRLVELSCARIQSCPSRA